MKDKLFEIIEKCNAFIAPEEKITIDITGNVFSVSISSAYDINASYSVKVYDSYAPFLDINVAFEQVKKFRELNKEIDTYVSDEIENNLSFYYGFE